MIQYSIIIPTINRKKELDQLLASICQNKVKTLEVIVVDQNQDNRLETIIQKYQKKIKIQWERVRFIGASKARNYGAKIAKGNILNFPDDDCQIAEQTIEMVEKEFAENPELIGVCGRVEDPESKHDILQFRRKKGMVTYWNVYQTTIECNLFIKKEVFLEIGMFDEELGVGTYFGAEEGADMIFRLLYQHKKIGYLPETLFYHPSQKKNFGIQKSFSYGLGFGAFVKKQIQKEGIKSYIPILYTVVGKIAKNIARLIKAFLMQDRELWDCQISLWKGRKMGFREYNPKKE